MLVSNGNTRSHCVIGGDRRGETLGKGETQLQSSRSGSITAICYNADARDVQRLLDRAKDDGTSQGPAAEHQLCKGLYFLGDLTGIPSAPRLATFPPPGYSSAAQ